MTDWSASYLLVKPALRAAEDALAKHEWRAAYEALWEAQAALQHTMSAIVVKVPPK